VKRLFVVLLPALAVAGAGVWGAARFHPKGPGGEKGAGETYVVSEGPVDVVLKETGVVKPRQSVAVKSKVSGKIREILVLEGEAVKAGQLVAVVEPDAQSSLTLSSKRMELKRLKIDLDQKERELRRQSRLAGEGLVASQLAEEAERDFQTAQNLYRQEKTSLNLLEREANQPTTKDDSTGGDPTGLTDYRILAPISGIVASVKVKPGELATSGTTGFSQEGALLMEIADQSRLEVVVNVNEIDVPKVHPGMPAKVTLAARPGKPLPATVDRVAVAPVSTATTDNSARLGPADAGKVIVYAVALKLTDRPEELRQGMTATVDLTLESKPKVLRIPILAYAEKDGKTLVKKRAKAGGADPYEDREATIGLKSDKFVEVKAGLAAGDVIAARYPAEPDAKKK
jgi:RND family efflux transporter MFP subunit